LTHATCTLEQTYTTRKSTLNVPVMDEGGWKPARGGDAEV